VALIVTSYPMYEDSDDRIAALKNLYARIKQVAKAMGGTATEAPLSLRLQSECGETPSSEDVSELHVAIGDSFQVKFCPSPLSNLGNTFSVTAWRVQGGFVMDSQPFSLRQGEWRRTQSPLSDDEIRKCLTPQGPKATVH
jgi:hypothetical protein